MTDINQSNWSEVDTSNTSSTNLPGFPEGMNPSGLNDSARAVMGAIRRWYDRSNATVTSGGTGNSFTLTYDVAPDELVAGDTFRFIAGATNTGPTTISINEGTAISCVVFGTSLVGGELVAGQVCMVIYDGEFFQVLNPQSAYKINPFFIDTGGVNAMQVAAGTGYRLHEGLTITVWAAATNTGSTTIGFGSTVVAVLRPSGAALQGGDIQADEPSRMIYDGSAFRLFLDFSQQFAGFNSPLVGMPNGSPSEVVLGTGLAMSGNTLICTVS